MTVPNLTNVADHDNGDPFAEGRAYPATVEHWPDDDGPWKVTLDWQVTDGRIECKRIEITTSDPALAVTPGVIRDLRLGERIRRQRAELTARAAGGTGTAQHAAGMRRSTRARLEEAARIYREAFTAGQSPARAVAEHFGLSSGGASSLVHRAREAGLLPPTSPGAPQG